MGADQQHECSSAHWRAKRITDEIPTFKSAQKIPEELFAEKNMKKYIGIVPLILSLVMSYQAFYLVILLVITSVLAGCVLVFVKDKASGMQSVVALIIAVGSVVFWYVYRLWFL